MTLQNNKTIELPDPEKSYLRKWGLNIHLSVSLISLLIIASLILTVILFNNAAADSITTLQNLVTKSLGWFLILVVNIYPTVVIILALSKLGKIRIGGADAKPEFSTFAWYSMLFSAGMGIGIMFWSVAEPIKHFETPPPFSSNVPETIQSATTAMSVTFFHWGFHAWGVYTLVGLALSFFTFNRGLPLTPRSIFYPFLKHKIYGWQGNAIDSLALIATLFGLATSLGLGVQQVNAGLNFLVNFPYSPIIQVVLITVITAMATLSVVSGLDKGVQMLSKLNVYLAFGFLIFILIVGPTGTLLVDFFKNLGQYAIDLPKLSFWLESLPFSDSQWQGTWTIFYWGWWISWSPFVGSFIARISKGRTVREFVFGVLFVPTLVTCIWMSIFGETALTQALNGNGVLTEAVQENVSTALFVMLQNLPLTMISSIIGVALVVSFFVTSSDSGSLVVDQLSAGGQLNTPVKQRIFWAALEGIVAAILLLGGGLETLQTVAVMTGIPFAFILLAMCFSLRKALLQEHQ